MSRMQATCYPVNASAGEIVTPVARKLRLINIAPAFGMFL